MNLEELADRIGAVLREPGEEPAKQIHRVCAANRMSDLLNGAAPGTVLITGLTSPQLLRMADIMEVPAVCLVKGARPPRARIEAAVRRGTAVLLSPRGLRETRDRIAAALAAGADGGARRAQRDPAEDRGGVHGGR